MKKPLIILSPQGMKMEEPFEGIYSYSSSFNTGAVLDAGGLPLLPPFMDDSNTEALLSAAHGLLLTGGEDISPELYGEKKMPCCGRTDLKRDLSDYALLKAALKLKKPVLCICRGAQLANVYFGGSLYQDLKAEFSGSLEHSQYGTYERPVAHEIFIQEASALHKLLGESSVSVNSLHHQGIKQLGKDLVPMAFSADGLTESFRLDSGHNWLRAYQWHPEMLKDNPYSKLIFKDFISACQK